ncbi:hypothetical protein HGB25_00530 [Candidatus Saccharibacteria bacterium]|nr:hypothetical protein [Candidatus Saccharibacteria bacterium]
MKKSIKVMLAGILAIPMLAFGTVLVAPITTSAACDASGGIQAGADCAKGTGQSDSLFGDDGIFKKITNTALYIIGAVSVLMLIYGGIRYTISGGDSANVTAAKNTIMYAVIGIIVALLAYAIVNFVLGALVTTA